MDVGNTPLVKLSDKLYGKLESVNPGGSIKDRPVKYILDAYDALANPKDKEIYAKRRVGLKRYGEPEEVAHATLNLCLPSSSYINGVYLPVDGGLSIRRA